MTLDQVLNPLGRLISVLSLELHFQNSIRERVHILLSDVIERRHRSNICTAPVVPRAVLPVVVLTNHRQVGVQRDANAGVTRKLKCSAVVEGANNGVKFFLSNGLLNLLRQLQDALELLVRLSLTVPELLYGFVHRVFALQVCVDVFLLNGETGFDARFSRPVLAMCFALDKDFGLVHVAVPTETKGLGSLRLLQTAQVKIKLIIVEIDAGNSRIWFLLALRTEDQYRQILQNDTLDLCDVVYAILSASVAPTADFPT